MTAFRPGLTSTCVRAACMLLLVAATGHAWPESAPAAAEVREWRFRVWLGESAIGQHSFRLTEQAGRRTLETEADFRVRLLFFTAYRYRHVNTETWTGDCLQAIESRTNANGRVLNVVGSTGPDGFELRQPALAEPLPGCVKSFAYWDTGILDEEKLLNPQTGELTKISVEALAPEDLQVRGREVPARKYRLLANNLLLDIWYSSESEWLALESTTRDGRKLRYELM